MTPQETLTKHGISLESYAPGRHYTICPKCSHTRTRPHQKNKVLGITIGDDGSVCWGCNHCAWTGPEKGSGERRELISHIYRDKGGVVRFRKVRNLPGRDPKCWFERPDGRGGWIKGSGGADTKILYRADEVAKAIAEGRVICCVEGEKDADNLWAIGIAATSSAHGAADPTKKQKAKWYRVHSEQLAGADIVVLNDNDSAGYEHADTTCRFSLGVVKRVRRLDLAPHWPDMPKGADVSDWLALGHTRAELDPLIAAAPDYAPTSSSGTEGTGGTTDDAAELERLARLAPLDYDRARKDAGKRLGISRLSLLDSLVKAKRAELGLDDGDDKQGEAIEFPAPEPWPEPIVGAALLDEIANAVRKHVVMTDQARDTVALWALHTYVIRRFAISPKLFVRSAARGCGKSTLLEVLSHLVARPMLAANITTATAFRIIAKHQPTLLVDEVDTFLGDNEELRGILDASHRHDGHVPRLVGDNYEPRNFRVYTAVALAGIGSLHSTLMDRAIIVDLQRRRAGEPIASLRIGKTGHLDDIARRIVRFIADNEDRIAAMEPTMPHGIFNRVADNWFALLAIADVAGRGWPQRARKAAEAARIAASGDEDWLELLLADVRDAFGQEAEMASTDLVETLVAIEGRPWAEMGKNRKPLTKHGLAYRLRPLGIITKKIGPGKTRINGYVRADFEEAFARYLPPEGDSDSDGRTERDEIRTSDDSDSDGAEPSRPSRKCEKSNNDGLPSECPSRKGGNGDARAVAASEPCAAHNPESASDPTELCAYCGRPGGNLVATGDGPTHRLHRECEDPWLENRMAQEASGEPEAPAISQPKEQP
jgi:putative DNA primase/helicase